MRKIIILLMIVCTTSSLLAQDTTKNDGLLRPNQIYIGTNGTYLRNNQKLPTCDIGSVLTTNADAYKEYSKYKSLNHGSTIGGLAVLAGCIAGICTLNSSNNLSGKILLASFIPIFIGIHFSNKAGHHFTNAINVYNKQY